MGGAQTGAFVVMVTETTRLRFDASTFSRLRALGRRVRSYLLLDGLALVSVAVLASVLITLGVDWTFRLGWDMRLTQLSTLLLALAVVAWWSIVRPLRVPIRADQLAVLVERRHPELRSRLISAVEFVSFATNRPPYGVAPSPMMIEAVVREAEDEAGFIRFKDALVHRRALWRSATVLGCMAVMAILSVGAPKIMGPWFRRNVLLADVDWPQRNRLTVENLVDGQLTVARGDDKTITAVVDKGFEAPRQVYIRYKSESGLSGRDQMPTVGGDRKEFTYTFERINETMECRISGGDAVTDWFTVKVVDRPRITQATLTITPPAYRQAEAYQLREGQTVARVLEGSGIGFAVETNKPVRIANLIQRVRDKKTGRVEETIVAQAPSVSQGMLNVAHRPSASGTYHFHLVDELGLSNKSERTQPVRFTVQLQEDQAPSVKMQIEGVGEMVTLKAVLPVRTDFADDYGLASAELVCASPRFAPEAIRKTIPGFDRAARTLTFAHTQSWAVGAHGFVEGDRFTLNAEAGDFDDVPGPNVGKASPQAFRVVSEDELLAELHRLEQEYRQDFERVLKRQEELYADLLTMSQGPDPNAEQDARPEQFARLARRQRDQAGRLNTLRMQFDRILSELRINQLSDAEVERRLGDGVIEPMGRLVREGMPTAGERLTDLSREETPPRMEDARAAQDALVADMRAILASMRKWEHFQEAVILLRDVLKMQRQLMNETEKRIEDEIIGTRPAR